MNKQGKSIGVAWAKPLKGIYVVLETLLHDALIF